MNSAFQKADWIDEDEADYYNSIDSSHMYFRENGNYKANIAFMERELEYYQNIVRHLKETLAEKKEIVKEKLQKLKENKTLSKEQKEKKKRQIMNRVFQN